MITLRKYRNRRLYNPVTSAYISLDDVRQYVERGEVVKVVTHDKGEDLTCEVLWDVLKRKSPFDASTLSKMIRTG